MNFFFFFWMEAPPFHVILYYLWGSYVTSESNIVPYTYIYINHNYVDINSDLIRFIFVKLSYQIVGT